MRLTRRALFPVFGVLLFLVVLCAFAAPAFAAPSLSTPIDSSTGSHIENALTLSQREFSSGAPVAVLADVASYPDALTGSVLAGVCHGPLLLTSSPTLTADVAAELKRLKPAVVYVVGLPTGISDQVGAALLPVVPTAQVVTILGSDRYQTARLVAGQIKAKLGSVSRVIIAPGDSYQGALAATALAAAKGWPILLTPASGPFSPQAAAAIGELGVTTGIEIGTNVAPGVAGFTVTKTIVGTPSSGDSDGRYDASSKLAEYAYSQGWSSYAHVGFAPGFDFPDGAALAPCVARDNGILLLAGTSSLPTPIVTAMTTRATLVQKVDFIGLGWSVYRQVKSLNSPRVTGLSASSGSAAGGNSLVVAGSALSGVTDVWVGKTVLPRTSWRIDSATQLTITNVPAGEGPGPVEVIVTNFWGKSPANTKDIYIYTGGTPSPGDKIVQEALKYVGVPYLWAGASPSSGFDCSGLVTYVYSRFGITLPHYSRLQATFGTYVAKEDLMPGDLVFFYSPISHVGIYVGGGMMINSPRSGDLVTIENAYRTSYVTARRIISPYSRYEQSDPDLDYTGTWNTNSSASYASGGSFCYANSSGASVTATFNGTAVFWVTKKSPVYGIAEVVLDGGDPVDVDLYNSTEIWQQTVWQAKDLAAGTHTLTVRWTGRKNAAATATNIGLDAVDVLGELGEAPPPPPPPPPPAEPTGTYTYLRGVDRFDTAMKISQAMYSGALPAGSGLVLAPGETFPEALCGAPLAAAWGGPVLLTPSIGINSGIVAEMQRLAPDYIFCVGLSNTVVDQVMAAMGPSVTVKAIRGTNVYDMSYRVATELGAKMGDMSDAVAIVTRGTQFPDAIGVSPLACANKWPILLTEHADDSALNLYATQALNELGITKALKAGTYVSLPGWVTGLDNLSGADRYQTVCNVAAWGKNNGGLTYAHTGLATGDKFPDALAAGPYLAQESGILLLSPLNGPLPVSVAGQLGANAAAVGRLSFIAMIEPVLSAAKGIVSFTEPGTEHVVVIDPGHQAVADLSLEPIGPGSTTMKAKVSAGTAGVSTGTPEYVLNLVLSLKLRDALQAQGITVVMTRTTHDVNVSNSERAQIANQAGADLFIRMHADASTNQSVHGVHVLYPATVAGWTDDIAVASKAAATLALTELCAATGATNLGLVARSDMTGFNWSDVPAIIPEVGYMTNPAEDQLMATSAYQDKIVQGLTKAIVDYLKAS